MATIKSALWDVCIIIPFWMSPVLPD